MSIIWLFLFLIIFFIGLSKSMKQGNERNITKTWTKNIKNDNTMVTMENMENGPKGLLNKASRKIYKEEQRMDFLDGIHDEGQCKYSTQDVNFSFEGLPNNYDDFATLRKKNAAHEKHLEARIYK